MQRHCEVCASFRPNAEFGESYRYGEGRRSFVPRRGSAGATTDDRRRSVGRRAGDHGER